MTTIHSGLPDPTSHLDRITVEPGKCGGRPCIRRMRIRVQDVLELLATGGTIGDVLEHYSALEREDVVACLQYAAKRAGEPTTASAGAA